MYIQTLVQLWENDKNHLMRKMTDDVYDGSYDVDNSGGDGDDDDDDDDDLDNDDFYDCVNIMIANDIQ